MKKILLIVLVILLGVLSLYAGWTHIPYSKTEWTDRPTPVTLWRRLQPNNVDGVGGAVFPVNRHILIYEDSVRQLAMLATNSWTEQYDTGYWQMTTNFDLHPHTNLTAAVGWNNNSPGGWLDVEWGTTNGDVFAQP